MARWTPCKRRDFISKLRHLGFDEPRPGRRHFYMIFGKQMMIIPNNKEFSVPQLRDLLKQVEKVFGREISLEEWQEL